MSEQDEYLEVITALLVRIRELEAFQKELLEELKWRRAVSDLHKDPWCG